MSTSHLHFPLMYFRYKKYFLYLIFYFRYIVNIPPPQCKQTKGIMHERGQMIKAPYKSEIKPSFNLYTRFLLINDA